MKKDRRYIITLGVCFVLLVTVQFFSPKPIDWNPTFLPSDKNPFGAYVTDRLLEPFFNKNEVMTNNSTFYELKDSVQPDENLISFSQSFAPDKEDARALLEKVNDGCTAFISAYRFSGAFADTLNLFSTDVLGINGSLAGDDTTDLKFVLPHTKKVGYYYRLDNVSGYFRGIDSIKRSAFIISTNAWGKPVTIRIPWGKGTLILNSTPLVFTNNYLLFENNYRYAEQTLSYLPARRTWWTSFYQIGRLEAQTPLRFILNNEALRWAYYIAISGCIIFLLFESKRKQRIIPVVNPLRNTTLDFVGTIANMYYHANDHKSIAEKKIAFFMDQLRTRFYLSGETGDALIDVVARKSGNAVEETQNLFSLMKVIQQSPAITAEVLVDLNKLIEKFNAANAKQIPTLKK